MLRVGDLGSQTRPLTVDTIRFGEADRPNAPSRTPGVPRAT